MDTAKNIETAEEIDSKYYDLFSSKLEDSEKLVWITKHSRGSFFAKLLENILFVIIYSISAGLIAYIAILKYGLLVLSPFLFALVIQKFVSMVIRFRGFKQTVYAISKTHVMSNDGQETKSVAIKDLVSIEIKRSFADNLSNTGTLVFYNDNSQNYMLENVGLSKFKWFGISDPKAVVTMCKVRAKNKTKLSSHNLDKAAKTNARVEKDQITSLPRYRRNSRLTNPK